MLSTISTTIDTTFKNLNSAYSGLILEVYEAKVALVDDRELEGQEAFKKASRIASIILKAVGALFLLGGAASFMGAVTHVTSFIGLLNVISSLFLFAFGHDLAVLGRNIRDNYGKPKASGFLSSVPTLLKGAWAEIAGNEYSQIKIAIDLNAKDTFFLKSFFLQMAEIERIRGEENARRAREQ